MSDETYPINPDEPPIELVRDVNDEEIEADRQGVEDAKLKHPSSHPEHTAKDNLIN